jgi:hypothetical protein
VRIKTNASGAADFEMIGSRSATRARMIPHSNALIRRQQAVRQGDLIEIESTDCVASGLK